jgi:hypothetical protein
MPGESSGTMMNDAKAGTSERHRPQVSRVPCEYFEQALGVSRVATKVSSRNSQGVVDCEQRSEAKKEEKEST